MHVPRGITRLFGRAELDGAMDEEMRFHIAARAADLERGGMAAGEAERRARLEFGAVESYKEQCRETRRFHLLHGVLEDLRFGARMLRRSPGVSLLALFCLTAGIGATAAVCSWIEGILLRPFPAVSHQERLMAVTGTMAGAAGEAGSAIDLSWPDLQDLARGCTRCEALIVDRITGTTLSIGNRAEPATGSLVSSNYFDALEVHPILGRGFEPGEDVGRNAHPVTVISYRLWKRRYHGDPQIVGKTQMLDSVPHTIIGVAPEGFDGTFVGWAIEFWVPLSMQETFSPPGNKLQDRGARFIEGFVKLKPGATAAQAQQELTAVARRLEQQYPATNRARGIKLYPLWQTPFNNAGTLLPTLSIALVVVLFVLLIACANVTNLLLVRGLARRHEMTLRLAIGARRGRLLRQLLTEGFLLSGLAAASGLLFANWCRNLLVVLLPRRGGLTMNLPGNLDWRVLALSTGVCVLATVLFGLAPAVQASNVDLAGALRAESGGVVSGGRRGLLRSALIAVQVALSFVLLVGAGLLLESLRAVQNANPGFSRDQVLVGTIDFVAAGYDRQRTHTFQEELLDRLQALPGVESASFARIIPFGYAGYNSGAVAVDGRQMPAAELPIIDFDEVSPGFFATLGIPLLSGRDFSRADNESAPPVAIVNQAMAEQLWPGQDAVGRRIQVKGRWMQVVGVARTAKYHRLNEAATPFFYVPLRQGNTWGMGFEIRTRRAPEALTQALLGEVHALDANLAPGELITMRQQVERTMAPQRVALLLIALFAGLALVLATIGMYGVMQYTVTQSTRELGLRVALGAGSTDLLRLVLWRGARLTAVGLAAGAAIALGTSRLLGYLLYHVNPRDPAVFASALATMTIAAAAACLVPAWRAARVDPLRALRS